MFRTFGLPTLLAVVAAVPAQRPVRMLTSSLEVHQDPRLSPDGLTVAFRAPGKIGAVPSVGGPERLLVQSSVIGDYLWAPTSTGVYYIDGTSLRFVNRNGGASINIANLPGQQHRLWDIDPGDQFAYGTRFEPGPQTWHVWRVATTGSAQPVDIVSSQLVVDEVSVDPTDTRIVYREYFSAPFSAREYWAAPKAGGTPVSLTGVPLNTLPEYAFWIDAATIGFAMLSPTTSRPHLTRVGATTPLQPLTEGFELRRRPSISRNRHWIVCEAQLPVGGVPALLPANGGGLVYLVTERGYAMNSAPTIDGPGLRVAWCAPDPAMPQQPQIWITELDRELSLTPRAEIGAPFTIAMPIAPNEIGAGFLALGRLPSAFPLPNLGYGIALDPTTTVMLFSGAGGAGSLSVTLPLPNDPTLTGIPFYAQGLRMTPAPAVGAFTREAQFVIF